MPIGLPVEDELVFAGGWARQCRGCGCRWSGLRRISGVALLVGERGTGVKAVAGRIHGLSPMAAGEFVCVEAAEFGAGHGVAGVGVLLLRGLESVGVEAQAGLLRRLNAVAREVRVLVTMECDPRGMVATGRLHGELYKRIGTLELRVPALRERVEDLPALLGTDAVFGERAMDVMRRYRWPGNLLELGEVKARVRGLGRVVEPTDLELAEEPAEKVVRLDEVIERHVVDVLERVGGNKLRAAELLGISRSTLYRMLESVGA